MPLEIIVPRLGWSMEQGAFVAWLKKDGEFVQAGEPLFSIEGDKAIQEVESIDSGILRIAANAPQPGAPIHVGDVLGHLIAKGEAAQQSAPPDAHDDRGEETAAPPPAEIPEIGRQRLLTSAATNHTEAVVAAQDLSRARTTPTISPRALRVAAELGVDWRTVTGSGRTGRIRERDIRAAAGALIAHPPVTSDEPRPSTATGGTRPPAVFFGELLMRLATRQHERFVQARELDVRYTGAEANAAVSFANFGGDAYVVSAVPDHELGRACVNYLRQYGANADHVAHGEGRLGTFYLETGAPPRPAQVIYDRAGSAFSKLKPGQFDWDAILAGKRWLHWSGTAPAVGAHLPAVVAEACAAARRHGLRVSCDLNYRRKLWSVETARDVMTPLMRHVDVIIGNEEHFGLVLGAGVPSAKAGASATERCAAIAHSLRAKFNFSAVAITIREGNDSAERRWQGLLANSDGIFTSRAYPVAEVDRIGAGDAFAGALIYALVTAMRGADAIEFAAAAGCLKHSIQGDFNLVSRDEVLALVHGDTGQRIQR